MGMTVLLNIIIIFLVITFGFLAATLSYMKGFRTSSKVVNALEKFEGYNSLSQAEINRILQTIGYTRTGSSDDCSTTRYGSNAELKDFDGYRVCIYEVPDEDSNSPYRKRYFRFKVVTYIYFDVPLVNRTLALPVMATSDKIFDFKD